MGSQQQLQGRRLSREAPGGSGTQPPHAVSIPPAGCLGWKHHPSCPFVPWGTNASSSKVPAHSSPHMGDPQRMTARCLPSIPPIHREQSEEMPWSQPREARGGSHVQCEQPEELLSFPGVLLGKEVLGAMATWAGGRLASGVDLASVRSCLPEHGSWQGTGLVPGLVGAQLGAAPLLLLVLGDSFVERPSSPSPQPSPAPSCLSHISGCSSHPPHRASWAVNNSEFQLHLEQGGSLSCGDKDLVAWD